MSFLLVKAPLKFLFWLGVNIRDRIVFNDLHVLKFYPRHEFSV